MAEKRMFARSIVSSDAFITMSPTAQCLYFQLNLSADDDGVVNNPISIMRTVGAKEEDFGELVERKFLILLESGVYVIKHWNINNNIRADRKRESTYKKELSELKKQENGAYTTANNNQMTDNEEDIDEETAVNDNELTGNCPANNNQMTDNEEDIDEETAVNDNELTGNCPANDSQMTDNEEDIDEETAVNDNELTGNCPANDSQMTDNCPRSIGEDSIDKVSKDKDSVVEHSKPRAQNLDSDSKPFVPETLILNATSYAQKVFDILKSNDLPCCRGNFITFIQRDFKIALEGIHELKLKPEEVFAALENYCKVIELKRQGLSWWESELTFFNLCSGRSKTILRFLPENFNLDDYRKSRNEPGTLPDDRIRLDVEEG